MMHILSNSILLVRDGTAWHIECMVVYVMPKMILQ